MMVLSSSTSSPVPAPPPTPCSTSTNGTTATASLSAFSSQSPVPPRAPSSPDLGFRVLKLDQSNFRQWQQLASTATPEQIAEQLDLHIDHINHKASQEDLLFEILLKAGFKPTEKVSVFTADRKSTRL